MPWWGLLIEVFAAWLLWGIAAAAVTRYLQPAAAYRRASEGA